MELLGFLEVWKPCFCSLRTIVSRILAQNLTAGREWSKYWGEGLAQATTRMLDFEVRVVFKEPTRPESPSSSWVLLPRALLRIYVDKQLKLLVTN